MSVKSPDAADKAVGRRLRSGRLVLGMSQTDIAKAIGVTFQQVQKYEKGVNRVSGGRLLRIAELLNTSPNQLLLGESTKSVTKAELSVMDQMLSTRTGVRLAKAFLSLPNNLQHAIADFAQTLEDNQNEKKR